MWAHGTFYWNELMTHDVESAKRFYATAIGWNFEGMPMTGKNLGETYWIAKDGDRAVGGLFEMKGRDFAEVPEHWMSYLAVDDVDMRTKKAIAAGATVCHEPFDVPDVGRIAILRQPGGGIVGWITPLKS